MPKKTTTPTESRKLTAEKKRVEDVKQKINGLVKGRQQYEYKWFENISFDDGRHFTYYNKSKNLIENIPARSGSAARVNHISHRKIKDLQNTILMNDPRWKALPKPDDDGSISPEASNEASKKNYYLKDLFDRLNIKYQVGNMVYWGLLMPYAGIWWGWDSVEKDVVADVHDAFDLLLPGDLTDVQKASVVGKHFKRTVNEMQANDMYKNTDDLKPDNRMAGSDMKDQRLKEKYSDTNSSLDDSVIVTEVWQKIYLTDDIRKKIIDFDIENGEYKKEKIPQPPIQVIGEFGEPKFDDNDEPVMQEVPPIDSKHWTEEKPNNYPIMYITTTSKECDVFHREQYVDFSLYPLAVFTPESGNLLKPAWIERIMSANKSLDVLQSRIEDYANIAGGRLMKKAGTETSRYETEVGTEIEWDGDQPPEWEQAPELPQALPAQIANLKGDIAEQTVVGGNVANVAHNGRGQGAMESIKSSDMSSVKTAIDNLANFMEQSASIIMSLNDYYLSRPKMIYQASQIGSSSPDQYFKVIGGQAAAKPEFSEAYKPESRPVILDKSTTVKVTIDTGLAYTEQAKRDTMFQLAQMGYLPAEVVLEMMKFDNVSDMMAMLRAQQAGSMIDTPDFQSLDPDSQLAALQNAMAKGIKLDVDPRKLGTAKKISNGLAGSAHDS